MTQAPISFDRASALVAAAAAPVGTERVLITNTAGRHGIIILESRDQAGQVGVAGGVGDTLVMGLPGNPGSALITARLVLAPLVAGLTGQVRPASLGWIDVPVGAPIPATGDRETFFRASLIGGKVIPVANQDSGAQRALAEAGWLVRCAAEEGALAKGAMVSVLEL